MQMRENLAARPPKSDSTSLWSWTARPALTLSGDVVELLLMDDNEGTESDVRGDLDSSLPWPSADHSLTKSDLNWSLSCFLS